MTPGLLVLGGRLKKGVALALAHIFFSFTVFIFGCSMDGGSFTSFPFILCMLATFGFCYMHCAGHFCWDMAHSLSYQ